MITATFLKYFYLRISILIQICFLTFILHIEVAPQWTELVEFSTWPERIIVLVLVSSTTLITYGLRDFFNHDLNYVQGAARVCDRIIFTLPVLICAASFFPILKNFIFLAYLISITLSSYYFTKLKVDQWQLHPPLRGAIWAAPIILVVAFAVLQVFPVSAPRAVGSYILVVSFALLFSLSLNLLARSPLLLIIASFNLLYVFGKSELTHKADTEQFPANAAVVNASIDTAYLQSAYHWLGTRADYWHYKLANLPYPMIVVTSEGGGGYALSHAFSALTKLQSRCPNFVQHTFALVGVSGGQVGNAIFHSNLDDEVLNPFSVDDCTWEDTEIDVTGLSQDNLSPILANLLFVEFPAKFFHFTEVPLGRSQVMERSFQQGFGSYKGLANISYLEHYWQTISNNGTPRVVPIGKPMVVSLATNVDTGRQFVFAPSHISRGETYRSLYSFESLTQQEDTGTNEHLMDTSFGSATIASASFPWVSPSLKFETIVPELATAPIEGFYHRTVLNGIHKRSVNLVDGGYFDNTGLGFISNLLADLSVPSGFKPCFRLVEQFFFDECYSDPAGLVKSNITNFPDMASCNEITFIFVHHAKQETKWEDCNFYFSTSVFVIRSETSDTFSGDGVQHFLTDPIETMLNTRGQQQKLLIQSIERLKCPNAHCLLDPRPDQLRTSTNLMNALTGKSETGQEYTFDTKSLVDSGLYQSSISAEILNLPLGWHLSPESQKMLVDFVIPNRKVCEKFVDFESNRPKIGIYFNERLEKKNSDGFLAKNCAHFLAISSLFQLH